MVIYFENKNEHKMLEDSCKKKKKRKIKVEEYFIDR